MKDETLESDGVVVTALIMEADNIVKGADVKFSLNLTAEEKKAIIVFLHTLTDYQFITEEKFSSPFN